MNAKLQAYLINKYPRLYKHDINCSFNDFYFECGDGWFRMLLWLSDYLQNYIDHQNDWCKKMPSNYSPVEQIQVLQVKEKFSTLRYYFRGGNKHTDAVIAFVEYMSGKFCEFTGQTEDVGYNDKGWTKRFHKSLSHKYPNFNPIDDPELLSILEEIRKEDKA